MEKGIPDEWKTGVVVPIYNGKGVIMNWGSYKGMKLLEHAIKIVESSKIDLRDVCGKTVTINFM